MAFIKKNIPIFIIIIFHVVGFVGFMVNPSYFKPLSPLNILLSVGLVFLMANQKKWQFYAALLLVAVLGFFIEVVGVKTELIFGTYNYGPSLGPKLFAVPLLIGVNWAVLIYSTAQFCKFNNKILNALLGAFLMVGLDFFMEHNAARFDFWYWKNGVIPLQNYIAWFIFSFFLNYLVQKQLSQKDNLTAKAFYAVQVVFFAALYYFV